MRDFAMRLIPGVAICLLYVYLVVANHAVKHREAVAGEKRREAADYRYLHNLRQEITSARRRASSSSPNFKTWDYRACVEALSSQEGE